LYKSIVLRISIVIYPEMESIFAKRSQDPTHYQQVENERRRPTPLAAALPQHLRLSKARVDTALADLGDIGRRTSRAALMPTDLNVQRVVPSSAPQRQV
jgi:hypothetical protein